MKHRLVLRNSSLFAAVSLVLASSPFSAKAVNLLLNPGFEAPSPAAAENTTCTGWTFVPTAVRANFNNHTPGGQFMIWARTWEPLGGGVYQTVSSISAGATYNFSSYLYFESGYTTITDPVAAQLKLTWLDSSDTPIGSPSSLSITPSASPPLAAWTQYNLNAVAPAGAAKVQAFVGWTDGGPGTGAQSVFFDDAILDGPGIPPTGAAWAVDGGGDWNVSGSWTNGSVPNGIGAEATLGSIITAPRTVYADTPITVGTLNFDNANLYNLSGAASLTMQVSAGTAAINVVSGSHKVNLPLIFASSTNLVTPTGTTLTLADPVLIKTGKTVNRIGTGNVLIQAPLTIESGGTLAVGAGPMTLFSAATLGTNARINVGTQSVNFDYHGQSSPASTIEAQVTTGYRSGLWNGAGVMTSSGNASTKGLGWVDDSSTSTVKVRFTYYGDSNLSGTVDSTDFNAFLAGYGLTAGAVWANGDYNYDDKVNTKDFNFLAGNFGAAPIPAPSLGSVVPEPVSGAALALVGMLATTRRRSR